MITAFVGHPVIFTRRGSSVTWDTLVTRIKKEYAENIITIFPDSKVMERIKMDALHEEIATALRESSFDPTVDFFLAAGDMTIFAAMLLVSADYWGKTPRQLRHIRNSDTYEILPSITYATADS